MLHGVITAAVQVVDAMHVPQQCSVAVCEPCCTSRMCAPPEEHTTTPCRQPPIPYPCPNYDWPKTLALLASLSRNASIWCCCCCGAVPMLLQAPAAALLLPSAPPAGAAAAAVLLPAAGLAVWPPVLLESAHM